MEGRRADEERWRKDEEGRSVGGRKKETRKRKEVR